MLTVCRILIAEGQTLPHVTCEQDGPYYVVCVPEGLDLFDTKDLCQIKGCRKPVTKGAYKARLTMCAEHAEDARSKQRLKTALYSRKNEVGLCASALCQNARGPSRRNPSVIGRMCSEHADRANARVKNCYARHKKHAFV